MNCTLNICKNVVVYYLLLHSLTFLCGQYVNVFAAPGTLQIGAIYALILLVQVYIRTVCSVCKAKRLQSHAFWTFINVEHLGPFTFFLFVIIFSTIFIAHIFFLCIFAFIFPLGQKLEQSEQLSN